MIPSYQFFEVSAANHIGTVVFNRPEKSNALNMDAWKEMKHAFEWMSQSEDVRVVVLAGNGKHFCAGIDLSLLMDVGKLNDHQCEGRKREKIREFILFLQDCISTIEKCRKPVIAAIHGACIGGGLDVITACDMRFAAAGTFLSIKEVDMGLVADIGTLQRLPKIVPPGVIAELAFTGRNFSADEALNMGLVNAVFDTREALMTHVHGIAATIASKSPLVIRGSKEIIRYSRENNTDASLEYMATYNAAFLLSDDLQEAFRSQMTKEPPIFKN